MNRPRRRVKTEQESALKAVADDEGVELIHINYGEETYSPVQYTSFKVGGHFLQIRPKKGESIESAIERGSALLKELVEKEFETRLKMFAVRHSTSKKAHR